MKPTIPDTVAWLRVAASRETDDARAARFSAAADHIDGLCEANAALGKLAEGYAKERDDLANENFVRIGGLEIANGQLREELAHANLGCGHSPKAMPDRQPIATAPRDGTFVMLFGGTTNEEFSRATRPEACQSRPVIGCYVPGWIWRDAAGNSHEGCWAYAFWDDAWYSIYEHPTHWAPLDEQWARPATEFDDEHKVQSVDLAVDLRAMLPPTTIRVEKKPAVEGLDFDGRRPSSVIGRFFSPNAGMPVPAGRIVAAMVDGVGVMMLTVVDDTGREHELVPLTLGRIAP